MTEKIRRVGINMAVFSRLSLQSYEFKRVYKDSENCPKETYCTRIALIQALQAFLIFLKQPIQQDSTKPDDSQTLKAVQDASSTIDEGMFNA